MPDEARDDRSELAEARNDLARGDADTALARLGRWLQVDDRPPLLAGRAGQTVAKALEARGDRGHRIALLGQVTTTWLAPMVVARAWADGIAIEVEEGGFDNVVQDLDRWEDRDTGKDSDRESKPELVVLIPGSEGRPASPGDAGIDAVLEPWRLAWRLAERLGSRIVQVGFDWTTPGPHGYLQSAIPEAEVSIVHRLNDELREALANQATAQGCFVDLSLIAGWLGRQRFYDPRRAAWTRQPFSEAGAWALAAHLWAACRALLEGPRKVLVLDLDNTLWGGVVGELGPLGVELGDSPAGEAFRAFQRYCRGLSERGVVLAVASKNNPADARGPFEDHPDMVLRLEDFAAFEAGWGPKSEALSRIARQLDLGLEHMVFFDDNPAERDLVRQALPAVRVVEVPPDPADYVHALVETLAFETATITDEDRARVRDYRAQASRRALRDDPAVSLEDYLVSLTMRGTVRDIDDADMPRVLQLLAKTNQWNLTTRRHGEAQVRALLERPRSIGLTLRLTDRFGDSGLVAVLIAVPDEEDRSPEGRDCLVVETWLMSCRVIARTAEHFLFRSLVHRARALGYRRLIGVHRPTAKNALVADLYSDLSFEPFEIRDGEPEDRWFTLDLGSAKLPWTAVEDAGTDARG